MGPEADVHAPDDERFVVRGQLGAGGMGVVYRVFDQARGREVALKTLSGTSARDLYRFKREFRALCDLAHPNLCALHELHTAGDELFFTMELVDGESFLDWVRPMSAHERRSEGPRMPRSRASILAAPVRFDRLIETMIQLCDGVFALHVAGKLHRDLKPSNVMCETGGRVVLLDFGLVAQLERAGPDFTHTRMAVGTPSYMSPEQAADLPLGPASDWYSVGVMLYEALTGRRPFDGSTAEVVMRRKQVEIPPGPKELAPGTPDYLDALCRQLLLPAPEDRPDGAAILAALGAAPSTATATIERTVAIGPFVGRSDHLRTFEAARLAARDHGVAVVVRGSSGMGKSVLVQRFLAGRSADALVLAGRCFQRDNVPYKTLDMLIDALTDALIAMAPHERAQVLPADVVALARLFPVLRRVPEMASPPPLRLPSDPQELRARAWASLRTLLHRLTALRAVIVFVDDLQWGDLDSTGFLADLITRADRPPLLLILAYREEDADAPSVRELTRRVAAAPTPPDVRVVPVTALQPDEARELVDRLSGPNGARNGDRILREAAGHTMFLAELARAAGSDVALSLDTLLAGRIARLAFESRALLIVCAVASRPIALEVAGRAAASSDAVSAAAALRLDRLIRSGPGAGELIEPFHDRVRSAVVDSLTPEELRVTHRALAMAYRAAEPTAYERVIGHLLGAGLEQEAAAAAASAGATAEHALAFQRAADLYAIAIAHSEPTSTGERARLLMARARVLTNAGRLLEAATAYQDAIPMVDSDERLELERLRTEQTLRAGRLVEGMSQARALLARLGYELPTTVRGGALTLLGQRLRLRLRGLETRERPASTLSRAELLRVDVLWSVASGLTFANPVLGRLAQTWYVREALALGEPRRVGNAMSVELSYLSATGRPELKERVRDYAARARDFARRSGEPFQVALVDAQLGTASFVLGEFEESCRLLHASLGALREHFHGDRWQVDIAEIFYLSALLFTGRIRDLINQTPIFLADAIERGDVYAQHGIRSWRGNMAWLALDRPDDARRNIDEVAQERGELGEFNVHEWYQLIGHIQIDLYQGRAHDGFERLQRATAAMARSNLLRLVSIRVETSYLIGRTAIATALLDPGQAATRLAIARHHAAELGRETAPWASALGGLLGACAAAAAGDTGAAVRGFADAENRLGRCSLRLHAQVARMARGELLDGSAGAELRATADQWMRDQAVVRPERFSRVFAPRRGD